MSESKKSLEEFLFEAALGKSSAIERAAFLDGACRDNPALRARLDVLLEGHFAGKGFLTCVPKRESTGTITDAPMSPPEETPAQMLGRYKLLEKIGEGGFGEVWMAEQREPVKRRVALKIIKLGMDSRQIVARFEAERQALAMMDHPNIAKIFDAGTTDAGRPYFVMELVRGIKITEYCDQNQLPTKERLDLFIKVCQAIQHAHQKGIIHRDIKPSNILVTLHDGVPVPKVIDFGIAKATAQELTDKTVFTQFQQFMGTPAYISPEQAEMSGLDIDTRADIYSLGVLLYELLVGQTPFDAKEMMQGGIDALVRIIREREPLRPSTKLNTLPGNAKTTAGKRRQTDVGKLVHQLQGDLDWIVMKCLEKDRTRRYDTANGLAMDIQRHLANEPVVARPPSNLYRFQKLARRNKIVFAGIVAVAAALVVGAMLSTWQAIRAMRAEREQNRLRQQAQAGQQTAQHNLAHQYLRRGQSLSEQGDVAHGLHWMARAHKEAPEPSGALKDIISQNLVAWGEQWKSPRAMLLHDSIVFSVAFSPDGRRILTGSYNGDVQFWLVETGEPLALKIKHETLIWVICFSPDGRRLFTSSDDRTIRFSDAQTGEALSPPIKQDGVVFNAAFSPDSSRVVTGAGDGTVRLWDSASGKPVGVPMAHKGNVNSVAFSPDGRKVLTSSSDKTARLWDGETGEPIGSAMQHAKSVLNAAFSPDGSRLVTAGADNIAQLWSTSDGKPTGVPMIHQGVDVVVFSPDGHRLLTSGDRAAQLWNASTSEPMGAPMMHKDSVNAAAFSADGQQILTAGDDRTLRFWSGQTGESLGAPLYHEATVNHGRAKVTRVFATSNGWTVAGFEGHAVVLRNIPLENRAGATFIASGIQGEAVAFTPDGRRLLVGDNKGLFWWWSIETGEVTPSSLRHDARIWCVVISPDGKRALTGGADRAAKLWSLEGGERLLWSVAHERGVRAAVLSPDGKLVATACFDQTARLWSTETGQPVGSPIPHPNIVEDVAFNPDGTVLATACGDGAARLWSVKTGQQMGPVMPHHGSVLGLKFSPDGKRLVTGSRDRNARFWNVVTGQPTGLVMEHQGWVEDLCFSRDGRRLATASADGKIRIWSPETGELLGPPLEGSRQVWQVLFSPDGSRVAANLPACFSTFSPSLTADLQDPELWVQVLTWQEMDDNGVVNWLDHATWQARRQQLEKLRGAVLK
jgi:WD40 repeat protein/serine/threonine protein kinase